MLIAQTGTQTTPSTIAESQEISVLSNLWWLLPLAAVIVGLVLFFRKRKVPGNTPNLVKASKSSERGKNSQSIRVSTSNSKPSNEAGTDDSLNAARNKKKKEKLKGNRKNKPVPKIISVSPAIAKSDEPSVVSADTEKAVVPVIAEPKASIAVFEPLRDATKGRRKASAEFTRSDSTQETISRAREVESLFGGKFERAIPKPSLRTVANRWPQPTTEPPKAAQIVAPRQLPAEPVIIPNPIPQVDSATQPAAAKGLSSFVSKVKSSATTTTEDSSASD